MELFLVSISFILFCKSLVLRFVLLLLSLLWASA
nr:MAG TPA: hypothetical protein [Bacteriophage sp.]